MKSQPSLSVADFLSQKFCQPRWYVMATCLVLGITAVNTANAQLASQAVPANYQAGQYCQGDIKPFIPRGTPNKDFVADISCIRQQLQPYKAETQPTLTRYQAYKANAWLSYLGHEASEASLTKAGHYALNEAVSILTALKTGQVDKLPVNSDIPPTSGLKRPDLWATVLTIKQTPAFDKLTKNVADSEVKLMWAEAEFCEFGWRHSREHFSAADRWVNTAEITALNFDNVDKQSFANLKQQYLTLLEPISAKEDTKEGCHGTALPYVELPKVVIPEPVVTPTPQPIELKPAIVHFALDKSDLDNSSRAVIDELIAKLKAYPDADNLTFGLYGYTDSRASVAYNNALSKRRTGSVASYLQSQGISPTRIAEYPQGKSNLKRTEDNVTAHSLNRRVEIYLLKDGKPITDAQETQEILNQNSYSDLKREK